MAESKDRIYTIPLRHEWINVARDKRNKKAVNTIRDYLSTHLHSDNIKISMMLSAQINSRGIQKPPSKVKVKVSIEDGIVHAMVPGESVLKEAMKKGKSKGKKVDATKAGEQPKTEEAEKEGDAKKNEGNKAADKKEKAKEIKTEPPNDRQPIKAEASKEKAKTGKSEGKETILAGVKGTKGVENV